MVRVRFVFLVDAARRVERTFCAIIPRCNLSKQFLLFHNLYRARPGSRGVRRDKTPPGHATGSGLFLCTTAAATTGNRLLRTLGTRVRASPLTMHRQVAAMAQAPIAANFHQPLNVHLNFATEITLYLIRTSNKLTQRIQLRFAQVFDADIGINVRRLENRARTWTNQRNSSANFNPLLRKITIVLYPVAVLLRFCRSHIKRLSVVIAFGASSPNGWRYSHDTSP